MLAEDDGIFGPDAESTDVDVWKEAANPAEAASIEKCIQNQDSRVEIEENSIKPMNQKLGKASIDLLSEIGDANFFGEVSALKVAMDGELQIDLSGFLGQDYSSAAENSQLLISNAALDREKGTLNFSLPAPDGGTYWFQLEISGSGPIITLAGEISFLAEGESKKKTGRATFAGTIAK